MHIYASIDSTRVAHVVVALLNCRCVVGLCAAGAMLGGLASTRLLLAAILQAEQLLANFTGACCAVAGRRCLAHRVKWVVRLQQTGSPVPLYASFVASSVIAFRWPINWAAYCHVTRLFAYDLVVKPI